MAQFGRLFITDVVREHPSLLLRAASQQRSASTAQLPRLSAVGKLIA